MKQYLVHLIFNGHHKIVVEAENEEEAGEIVMEGQYDIKDVKDESEDFEVGDVEEIEEEEIKEGGKNE